MERRGQEHGEVTITRNFRLHCNSALIWVPSDKQRFVRDSNHCCCQIATPSEMELIAWTNLQSNNAICFSVPWEGLGPQIGGVRRGARGRPAWKWSSSSRHLSASKLASLLITALQRLCLHISGNLKLETKCGRRRSEIHIRLWNKLELPRKQRVTSNYDPADADRHGDKHPREPRYIGFRHKRVSCS